MLNLLFLLVLLLAPTPTTATEPPWSFPAPARLVAIGDVHGDQERFLALLQRCSLTDDKGRWTGGRSVLVQTGDVLDRGPHSKATMDLLIKLEKEAKAAGGQVHALLGNHEAMNMQGDLRYVSSGEFVALGDPPRTPDNPVPRPPLGDFPKLRAAFAKDGPYGQWLLTHNAVVRIGDTLFLHGGISPAYAKRDLALVNAHIRAELRGERPPTITQDPEGPLWFRGLAEPQPQGALPARLQEIFSAQKAQRIVMGHTIQEGGISLREGGQLVFIDVGFSRWTLGGRPACLVLERKPGEKKDKVSVLQL